MSEKQTPERIIRNERLEAIRDWDHPKYSTGVHVCRQETVQMAKRLLLAEAKVAEQAAILERLTEASRSVLSSCLYHPEIHYSLSQALMQLEAALGSQEKP